MKGPSSCRIYLLRHGETANAGKVCFNGHYDVDLSDHGKTQFRQISDALKGIALAGVYSSDLRRTLDCARIIGDPHGIDPVACPEMRELSFGLWEGMSVEEVQKKYPGQLEERLKKITTFVVEGGETFPQLEQRVLPKFSDIVQRHPEGNIVIVSHGGVNRVILGHLLGIPIDNIFRIHQDYAAVNIVQFYKEGDPVVELMGGTYRLIREERRPGKKLAIQ